MKAVLCRAFGPPSGLTLEEVPAPRPGPGQVLIRVEACAVNFPDTLIVQGRYQVRPPLPFSPGGEVAGVVAELGEGAAGPPPGTRVLAMTGHGGFAEMAVAQRRCRGGGAGGRGRRDRRGALLRLRHHAPRLARPRRAAAGRNGAGAGRGRRRRAGRRATGEAHGRPGDRRRVRRQAGNLPGGGRRRAGGLPAGGVARHGEGFVRKRRRRRGLRPRGRPVFRTGAALVELGRPPPRRRLRRRGDPAHPAQPAAAQGLRHPRRVLRRLRQAGAGREPGAGGPTSHLGAGRTAAPAHLGHLSGWRTRPAALDALLARGVTGKIVLVTTGPPPAAR